MRLIDMADVALCVISRKHRTSDQDLATGRVLRSYVRWQSQRCTYRNQADVIGAFVLLCFWSSWRPW